MEDADDVMMITAIVIVTVDMIGVIVTVIAVVTVAGPAVALVVAPVVEAEVGVEAETGDQAM